MSGTVAAARHSGMGFDAAAFAIAARARAKDFFVCAEALLGGLLGNLIGGLLRRFFGGLLARRLQGRRLGLGERHVLVHWYWEPVCYFVYAYDCGKELVNRDLEKKFREILMSI